MKDLEKLPVDYQRQETKTTTDDLVNTPKNTVMSSVWTLGIFQMVTGESCQCIRHTKQTDKRGEAAWKFQGPAE